MPIDDFYVHENYFIKKSLQFLILSGGVVYKPVNIENQKYVNSAMQEIFEKAIVCIELFQDKKSSFNILPIELKNYIFMITFDHIDKMSSYICTMNKLIEKKKMFLLLLQDQMCTFNQFPQEIKQIIVAEAYK